MEDDTGLAQTECIYRPEKPRRMYVPPSSEEPVQVFDDDEDAMDDDTGLAQTSATKSSGVI